MHKIPDMFTMPDGTKFSSAWVSQAIYAAFKKSLHPEPLEVKVHEYVMHSLVHIERQEEAIKSAKAALDVIAQDERCGCKPRGWHGPECWRKVAIAALAKLDEAR